MKIWRENLSIEQINGLNQGTIHDSLGIRFILMGDDYLEATMPVDGRTRQPAGILHGGASVVLAESLGSIATLLVVGSRGKISVGIEINASHLRAIAEGFVVGRVTPIRLGNSIHVWDIRIRDQASKDERLICQSRLTVMIRDQDLTRDQDRSGGPSVKPGPNTEKE